MPRGRNAMWFIAGLAAGHFVLPMVLGMFAGVGRGTGRTP